MTTSSPARVRPSLDAVVFDLVLIAFTTVIVWSALDLGSRARLVPLVVGVPTLFGLVILLMRDLRPAGPEPPQVEAGEGAAALLTGGIEELVAAAHDEELADDRLPTSREARRRQVILAVWALGFVAFAALAGFRLATPIALTVILLLTTRRLLPTIVMTAVASAALYLIFDVALNVAF